MMERVHIPGLRDEAVWYEIGYATGDPAWPLARLRLEPLDIPDTRQWQPNAPVAPQQLSVRFSASLVDAAGAVMRVASRLLLGPENIHSWSFGHGVAFDATAWIDDCASKMIEPLLSWADALQAAAAGRLIAVLPEAETGAPFESEGS